MNTRDPARPRADLARTSQARHPIAARPIGISIPITQEGSSRLATSCTELVAQVTVGRAGDASTRAATQPPR
ncbi:MAG TPA: hypothetical protein DCQ36_02285 [Actinobacteria bacterium]|nr:hypothetical protein [Actinomycetota bacterium]